MKQLRAIRRLMAALFLAACVACLVIGPQVHPMAKAAGQLQILLSGSAATAALSLVWLAITLLFGRIYCGVVCPVGTLADIFFWIRRRIPRLAKPMSYRAPSRLAVHILWVYLLCVVAGVVVVPFVIEPWNMARNAASAVNRDAISTTWETIGIGAGVGASIGILSLAIVAVLALWRGREFCTRYCPIGTALGYAQQFSLMHIEIDPDRCSSCGACEEGCRSRCIKVSERKVDQSRCVRCFDCVANCPEGAIRYQGSRNRPATPIMNVKQ